MTFDALVGDWTTEMTHPSMPGTVVHGKSVFELLEGEKFLIQRSRTDHPDFPDSLSVIGEFDDGTQMHYYDSRGVYRVYEASMSDDVLRFSRDEPGFAQRFEGAVDDNSITGLWKLCRDGENWADDLAITYRRP